MGYNPTRRYRDDRTTDLVLLVVGIVVIVLLLLWGVGVIG